jgi:hypothetical protein
MAVTTIREIRNNTPFPVTVRNLEDPADTADGRGDLAPNEVRVLPTTVEFNVPWCGDWEQNDFAKRHIRVQVQGRGTFFIWQASHAAVDRVRVSMDGKWHKPGEWHVRSGGIVSTPLACQAVVADGLSRGGLL